jgi:hypothetical protein
VRALAATAASASAQGPGTRTCSSVNQARPKSTPTDALGRGSALSAKTQAAYVGNVRPTIRSRPTHRTTHGQTCALTLDLYERGRGRGCRAVAGVPAVLACEVGGPSLYRRSRCGAGGLIGAAAAHSSPGQASTRCRSKVGARGKRLRAAGPCVLARISRVDSGQAGCASSSSRTL